MIEKLPEEYQREDWGRYKSKDEEYKALLDDIDKILQAAQDKEAAEKTIYKRWVPLARETRNEAIQLLEEFAKKYGENEKIEMLYKDSVESLKGEEAERKEEMAEKWGRRAEIESEFGLGLPATPNFTESVMEKIKKESVPPKNPSEK